MLRLSLRRRRQLLPWLFLGPGLLWLIVFFAIPLVNQVNVSLQSGDAETGYAFDWAFSTYTDAISDYHVAVHPLDRLRRDGDGAVPDHRLPARVLHRLQGRPLQEPDPAADHPAVLHVLRAADGGLAADPVRQRLGGRAHARSRAGGRRRAAAGLAHGRDRGHHLQLPAVHDPAAVRVAGEDRPAADRGGDRPLREPGDGVPPHHAAARPARDLRRLAADLHPGHAATSSTPRCSARRAST